MSNEEDEGLVWTPSKPSLMSVCVLHLLVCSNFGRVAVMSWVVITTAGLQLPTSQECLSDFVGEHLMLETQDKNHKTKTVRRCLLLM